MHVLSDAIRRVLRRNARPESTRSGSKKKAHTLDDLHRVFTTTLQPAGAADEWVEEEEFLKFASNQAAAIAAE